MNMDYELMLKQQVSQTEFQAAATAFAMQMSKAQSDENLFKKYSERYVNRVDGLSLSIRKMTQELREELYERENENGNTQ